jgi:hypothetical protein
VIIDCPSCGTSYRHAAEPAAEPSNARCSRCDEIFPLRGRRRHYRIVSCTHDGAGASPAVPVIGGPAGAAAARMNIGMDDPALAAQLEKTALDGGAGAGKAVLTYRVDATQATADAPVEGKTSAKRKKTPEARRRGARPLFKILFGLSTGAASGWAAFTYVPMTLEHSAIVAAAMAVVVSWVGLRWKSTSR